MRRQSDLSRKDYEIGDYVGRERWLTYFAQLEIVLAGSPATLLEIGVGPNVVRAICLDNGIRVTTVDVNDALAPDYVADVRSLPNAVTNERWDWVLCSRVIHHIPPSEVPQVLDSLAALHFDQLLLTVPREDLSIQLTIRRTAGKSRSIRISAGSTLKRALRRARVIRTRPSGLWMLGGDGGWSRSKFRTEVRARFALAREFVLPDDPAHVFFVLRKPDEPCT